MTDTGRLSKKERHELILSEVRKSAAIRISKLAKRIGVAYSVQQVPRIAPELWDVPLDAVITEQGWFER